MGLPKIGPILLGEDGACSNTGARSHPAGNSELRATW